MDVYARPAQGRDVSAGDFADVVSATVSEVEWAADGMLRVTFDGPLTDDEALRVRLRIMSADAVEERLRTDAAAFLSLTDPTPADLTAQVRRLTCLGLGLDGATS